MADAPSVPDTHKCGEPRTEHPEWYCLTCGCWGDMHPGACAGATCVCTNLHLRGYKSRVEQDAENRRLKGHYIRKSVSAAHYCQTPSPYYSTRGEVWQCDECHTIWTFKETWFERFGSFTGSWRPKR